jgi:hypothetical protein
MGWNIEDGIFPFKEGDIITLDKSKQSILFQKWEAGNRIIGLTAYYKDTHGWNLAKVSVAVDLLIHEGFTVEPK